MKAINTLLNINEVNELIKKGRTLVLAGQEELLEKLERGNWIGGTIPYFMGNNGGCFDKQNIFVTDITEYAKNIKITDYDSGSISNIINDRFNNGFSYILIPGFSEVLSKYAIMAPEINGLYDVPVIGWVTGIDLNEVGKVKPKIFNGSKSVKDANKIVVMHVEIPENKLAKLEILNIFQQGNGDSITFKEEGFSCTNCLVNSKEQNLAEYIGMNNIDTRLPLVADYSGAMINISFQNVDKSSGKVLFYAPLRKNVTYKLADPVQNYIKQFDNALPEINDGEIIASCNCILNYLYSELEGKKTSDIKGPFTFGEIAYVLVNQTMVYLSIINA